ncbi:MAG: 2-oxoacid:acceptor oxidoreductase family protein [Coriobacteriales bacterium]|jgi:indolepyruvate ferredoxin oxidoreductase beta subunit|nr:2-oxoacid:acceptor oxidoreductase family protein [Coriobacteriales bacterium]
MSHTKLEIVTAGVGGQGTVLASKLLAQSALIGALPVRTAETIGMAQRGGSVLGHIRIGAFESPLVMHGQADVLIGFEPTESLRALPYLREGGTVVTALRTIAPNRGAAAAAPAAASAAALTGRTCPAPLEVLRELALDGRIASLVEVEQDALLAQLGSSRVLNVLLIGAALAYLAPLSASSLDAALAAVVKPAYLALNRQALQLGRLGRLA